MLASSPFTMRASKIPLEIMVQVLQKNPCSQWENIETINITSWWWFNHQPDDYFWNRGPLLTEPWSATAKTGGQGLAPDPTYIPQCLPRPKAGWNGWTMHEESISYPLPSMYGVFAYIWLVYMVNVGKYTIHGCYGYWTWVYCIPLLC